MSKSIGGLWAHESKKGVKYMSGQVTIGDKKVDIVIFRNKYKEDKKPDYVIYKSEKRAIGAKMVDNDGREEDLPF